MVRVKIIEKIIRKKGAPAYMVSFGDMMTLILCFFILLVAMSSEQNYGLMAKGLGSFVVAIESFGLNGILDGNEKQAIFDTVRRRFNLPPEEDPERLEEPEQSALQELLRAESLEALKPRRALRQPRIARFHGTSTVLDDAARDYLDMQADSLRPGPGFVLLLEGHGPPRGSGVSSDPTWIAFRRSAVVREYLIEHLNFRPERVEARAWMVEIDDDPRMTDIVDARLIFPPSPDEESDDK